MSDLKRFVEKYHLAVEAAQESNPQGGLCGFELEWNLLDEQFRPVLSVGSGPETVSFVDYLRTNCLPSWLKDFSQLEVFQWMIEWATRPYYQPRGAVFEGRLMEAVLVNALHQLSRQFNEPLFHWHGNLPVPATIGYDSIPGSWHIAKRRYLERCVDLYGDSLATAGTHSNLSLPDPLFAWDFMHLSPGERGDSHLDDFKSRFYINATRLLRAFAFLFIATSASTPLQGGLEDGQKVARLTGFDSVRNLTFPNPPSLDAPDLYRSYQDYLQLSYDLVRRGVRFGNNNWTPVRARSFAEPVERLIQITSDQLQEIYMRGLYSAGEIVPMEDLARQIEIQNLMARINLPMARVEVRTDDGGHPLDVEIANLTLKHLLMLCLYADPTFGKAFRYDADDIARARSNEEQAARHGLRAEVENPFTGKPLALRVFLSWTLGELQPLATALGMWDDLQPLREMAAGTPNTAEMLRQRLQTELDDESLVPVELLRILATERQKQVLRDVEFIAETHAVLGRDSRKTGEFLQHARDAARADLQAPIRFRPRPKALVEVVYPDKTSEIIALAQQLIRIPSVTACPEERLDEVRRAATFIFDYLRNQGVPVRYFDQHKYPALLAHFPGREAAPLMLSGHFDVVAPEPDDSQFEAWIDGDYLVGRGAADMKTVVATYLVWMKDRLKAGGERLPGVNLLLVGNEENGESEPMGTPHVLPVLREESGYTPGLLAAGERTGEKGSELWGEVCTQNRGVMRFDIVASGSRGHSAFARTATPASAKGDLSERLFLARQSVQEIASRCLTLASADGWQSQVRFPFIQAGTPGVYNVTADLGVLGVEVRTIPQDPLDAFESELQAYCQAQGLELQISVREDGIACDPHNPVLIRLLEAIQMASGQEPVIGRKLPGTSARFAPAGQGIVWGQSGIGPHARNEAHFIPSILPFYRALQEL
jgi:acetylornithine deacetylase/succinyl-diaminopimelate desuccinylase-like protein/gamma-glutamyl:cysteine ligase YbdK (ATP-grasp superfamily)